MAQDTLLQAELQAGTVCNTVQNQNTVLRLLPLVAPRIG